MAEIIIGRRYRFIYPYYGTPDLHPDYTAHSGRMVKVIRQLVPPREVDIDAGATYEIEARDGWTGTAHYSELQER